MFLFFFVLERPLIYKNHAKSGSTLFFGKFIKLYFIISMRLTLLVIGKTDEKYLQEGIERYAKRLNFYIDFNLEVIPDIKKSRNLSAEQQKEREGVLILSKQSASKEFHLFDERGKPFTSLEFAGFLQKKMAGGLKELVFVIGGPYGFSEEVYKQAASAVSLSPMTFPHQLARLLCVEQIYRAYTILKGEPYHHE
jgi:23S rRNA (pseudouridine1915-N3)-methyltransferase